MWARSCRAHRRLRMLRHGWLLRQINVLLMVFNLLPIPPLDGWRVLLGLVDARTALNLRQFEQYGFMALAVDHRCRRRAFIGALADSSWFTRARPMRAELVGGQGRGASLATWRAGVGRRARAELGGWLTPAQLDLFTSMHRPTSATAWTSCARLRAAGQSGRAARRRPAARLWQGPSAARLASRGVVAGERYGAAVERGLARLPTFRARLRDIARARRSLGRACRWPLGASSDRRSDPQPGGATDPVRGRALLLADQAN